MKQKTQDFLTEVLGSHPAHPDGEAGSLEEKSNYSIIDGAQLVVIGIEGSIPYRSNIPGDIYISPDKQAAFTKSHPRRRTPNPTIFKGRYLKCRLKKNGNYQVTSCMNRDTIEKWTDADGKVNLKDIYRYQMSELQRILMIIEKRHSYVKRAETDSERGAEAAPAAELHQCNGDNDSKIQQEETEVSRA